MLKYELRHAAVYLFFAFISASSAASEPDLLRIEEDGLIIEYPQQYETVALKIHAWLSEVFVGGNFERIQDEILVLQEKKDEIIAYITKQLALREEDKPAREIIEISFTKCMELYLRLPKPNHLRLWERQELIESIAAGNGPPGVSYDEKSGKFQFQSSLQFDCIDKAAESEFSTMPDVFPVTVEGEDEQKQFEKAKSTLFSIFNPLNAFEDGGVPIHEAAEGPVAFCVTSPYRRWFSDGIANALAIFALRKFVSDSASESFLKLHDASPYQGYKQKVNLASWLNSDLCENPGGYGLSNARYAYATEEILGLMQRHGDDVIPRIFEEIHKARAQIAEEIAAQNPGTTQEKVFPITQIVDMAVVFEAIKKVTGEDFRKRLLEYSEPPPIE